MSILIKGMEMPKNCKHCKFRKTELQEEPDWCLISEESLFELAENDCPLVEVPPHGRLIDADKIGYHSGTWEKGCDWVMQSEIALMPTVIPADKDGEE